MGYLHLKKCSRIDTYNTRERNVLFLKCLPRLKTKSLDCRKERLAVTNEPIRLFAGREDFCRNVAKCHFICGDNNHQLYHSGISDHNNYSA